MSMVPGFMKTPAASIMQQMPDSWLIRLSGNTAASIKKERFSGLLKEKRLTSTGIMDRLMSQVYSWSPAIRVTCTVSSTPVLLFRLRRTAQPIAGPLDKMLAVDYKTYMVDDILVKVDRAGMSVPGRTRTPARPPHHWMGCPPAGIL